MMKQNLIKLSPLRTTNGHTVQLAATNRRLQRGLARHKTAEALLQKSAKLYQGLLRDSLKLQESLRQRTRRALTAQENDRKSISHELQDEIAQTLLGISVRLLNLQTGAGASRVRLTKEIATTQRLVVHSIQSINRFARQLNVSLPALNTRSQRFAK